MPKTKIEGVEEALDPRDEQINELSKQVSDLSALVRGRDSKAKKASKRLPISKVLFIDKNPVVEFGDVRDANGSMSVRLVIQFQDGHTEPREEEYSVAMNMPRFECEVIEFKKEEITTFQGTTPQQVPARPAGIRDGRYYNSDGETAFTPRMIDLEETKIVSSAKVRFLNGPWAGREIEVNPDLCLNK